MCSFCTNETIEGEEECDFTHEGCKECKIVKGWNCTQDTKVCEVICKDGLVVGTEVCDAGTQDGCLDDC